MKKLSQRTRLILVFFLFGINSCDAGIYIRVNQLGFLPDDYKSAVILSNSKLDSDKFVLKDIQNKDVYSDIIGKAAGSYGSFNYVYRINFSDFKKTGKFKISVNEQNSVEFSIGYNLYNDIANKLLQFYKVQRCGYTEPYLHEVCHIADVTHIIENGQDLDIQHDVTGGWHDAGDYTKFLNTTAFTTYMMLFAFEFDPEKFGFDYNKNSIPDILEEAKIGLDWLLRAQYGNDKFITQVQDTDDQNVGWRLPSEDRLAFDRPGFVGIGKNLIGIYVATMSIGYRIWRDEIKYQEFADKLLTSAENYYSTKDQVPDVDENGTGRYIDKNYEGKLGLAAIEMYHTTNNRKYLDDAKYYAEQAGSDFWWSWGDINALLQYKLSEFDISFVQYIENNLKHFQSLSDSIAFGRGAALSWGTNHALTGIILQSILYEKVTGDSKYRNLGIMQRDYILGKNPWGVSFIYGVGEIFTKNFHHQVAYFNGGKLPGGFAAGPIKRSIFDKYDLQFETKDRFSQFHSDSAIYIDDRMDYISNEPTISSNATAIFSFGFFANE